MTPLTISVRKDLTLKLHGFSGIAENRDWGATGKRLMDRTWQEVRRRKIPNKGVNVWVYQTGDALFTGIELTSPPPADCPLEEQTITIPRYAYYKHHGPYDNIKATYAAAQQELKKVGIEPTLPYLEIFGHHHDDPAQQETELIWTIR